MKQPTFTYSIDENHYTYPITDIHFDRLGILVMIEILVDMDRKYSFFHVKDNEYKNSYGNLTGKINWNI